MNIKRLLATILGFVLVLPLAGCATGTEQSSDSSYPQNNEASDLVEAENQMSIYPRDGEKIILANDEVYNWWKNYNDSNPVPDGGYKYADVYFPKPLTFSWKENKKVDYYNVFISTDKDFPKEKTETYVVNTNSLTVSHLYTDTEYYWKVLCSESVGTVEEKLDVTVVDVSSFTIAQSPRFLTVEGVSNTRDIGGIVTADGKKIKQGLVYRGGKLDDITESGKDFMLGSLGIKTDLDLRTPGEGSAGAVSPLGNEVYYVNIDGRYYTGSMGITNADGKAAFAEEIRLFANPVNYPVYIHCSLGRDRTGTLAMVLEALVGVEKEELFREYNLSIFSQPGTKGEVDAARAALVSTYDYINTFLGNSFAEKTENYLLSIGVTSAEIQSIKAILLGEAK